MRLILLLALPLALRAQVEVDTVIRLGGHVYNGSHIQQLNKLYVHSSLGLWSLDCSTWQATLIPTGTSQGLGHFAYSPVQRKLYFNATWGSVVIDATADTVLRQLPVEEYQGEMAYVPGRDRVYIGGGYGMAVVDCATDSIIRVITSPVPGYTPVRGPAYDSVADRVYAMTGNMWQGPPYFVVYDSTDSLVRVIPESPQCWPGPMSFCHQTRKVYYTIDDYGRGSHPGVVDADRLELIRSFPFRGWGDHLASPLALDLRDSKAYIPGDTGSYLSNSLFVIDCNTDSVIKAIRIDSRWCLSTVDWLPWSNRVYGSTVADRFVVVDCATDSIIASNVILPGQQWAPPDFALDPVRERIFAIGADTSAVHVLRDVPCAVADNGGSKLGVMTPVRVRPNPARGRVWLAGAKEAPLFAPDGRKVLTLRSGPNDLRSIPPGTYFLRVSSGSAFHKLLLLP